MRDFFSFTNGIIVGVVLRSLWAIAMRPFHKCLTEKIHATESENLDGE